jgi:hypothetical protein
MYTVTYNSISLLIFLMDLGFPFVKYLIAVSSIK